LSIALRRIVSRSTGTAGLRSRGRGGSSCATRWTVSAKRRAVEGRAADDEMVEGGAEPVDVGRPLDAARVARRLLGGHVGRGAREDALLREAAAALREPGEAEVQHEDPPAAIEHEIGGLEVAVDDALLVRGMDGARGDAERLDGLAERKRGLLQRPPLHVLHHDVGPPAFLGDPVDGDDVRVGEPGRDDGLAGEALQRRALLGQRDRELQRASAAELAVPGFPDFAGAAPAEALDEHEVRDAPRGVVLMGGGLRWEGAARYLEGGVVLAVCRLGQRRQVRGRDPAARSQDLRERPRRAVALLPRLGELRLAQPAPGDREPPERALLLGAEKPPEAGRQSRRDKRVRHRL
jgi:hypothetical protein